MNSEGGTIVEIKSKLNILNGRVMYNHYQKTGFLKDEVMVPFNEAMCYGETSKEIFSNEFITTRAKVHHVTLAQYKEITMKPIQPLLNQTFEHIILWFDDDMFCQINILTILAWLDQIAYPYPIELYLVDAQFKATETFTLHAQEYHDIYKQVLLEKLMPKQIQPIPLKKGIELYLSYLDQESDLMMFIQNHKNTPEKELLSMLLEKFNHYGLGDTQYLELIHSRD